MPTDEELKVIFADTKTIAVVGASSDPTKPGHRIPAYLNGQGFRIIPVSPKGGELFDREVVGSLADIDDPVDVVDVFRPSEEAPDIAKQAAAIGAKVLWLQTGIRSDEAAAIAARAGIDFVQDVCMGETHARLELGPGPD
jgi:predicted CoA-binding protein